MNRREFIAMTAVGTVGALGRLSAAEPRKGTVVAMPISAGPLFQADLDRLLEDMRRRAGVNVLMPFLYTHETHRAGVEAGFPGFRGGNYATPHMQFYRGLPLTFEQMRATEFGTADALERAVTACSKQGIQVYPWIIEDNHCPDIPAWREMYEVDSKGVPTAGHPSGPCKNNPVYRQFLSSLLEDYARSYPVAGFMWGAERQSGFLNTLMASKSRGGKAARATCFCAHCRAKAQKEGIDVERAKRGFAQIEKIQASRASGRGPTDGVFSSFWRAIMEYPELLAWESLWVRGRHDLQEGLYRSVKAVNPNLTVGWHLWQNMTFSPLQRAEEDYSVLARFSDFVRPAVYNNCAGERLRAFADSSLAGLWGDLSGEETYGLICRLMDYREAPYARAAQTGLSADYVRRETRRAAEGVAGSAAQVWPGIDLDVPVPEGASQCTPAGVKAAVHAAFEGGARGVILSRNYTEMKPENLSAAGEALRELGLI